jgi:hypothetical protein
VFGRCSDCGTEGVGWRVGPEGPTLRCPVCDGTRGFVQPPLCIVTGAAGTGKTTIRRRLAGDLPAVLPEDDCVLDEACDFGSEVAKNEHGLRSCRHVAQSGTPRVLFTTGMGADNVEGLDARRYFAASHYLSLVRTDAVHRERLRARGAPWTDESGGEWADVDRQVTFNGWFKRQGTEEGVVLLDTTDAGAAETAERVSERLADRLPTPAWRT